MKPSEFKNYLEILLLGHVDVKSFVWGNPFQTLQQLLQGKESPIAMVESPDVAPNNVKRTGKKRNFQSELAILQLTDEESEAEAIDFTLEILTEIDRKLEEEFQNDKFENYKLTSNMTQVKQDNHIGWRVTFEISYDINVHPNQEKWQSQ